MLRFYKDTVAVVVILSSKYSGDLGIVFRRAQHTFTKDLYKSLLRMFFVLCVRPADIRCIVTYLFKYRRRYAIATRRASIIDS